MKFNFLNRMFGMASQEEAEQPQPPPTKADLMDVMGRYVASNADELLQELHQSLTGNVSRFHEISKTYPTLITAIFAVDEFIKKHQLDLMETTTFFLKDGEVNVCRVSVNEVGGFIHIRANDEISVDKERFMGDQIGYSGDYIKKTSNRFIVDEPTAIQYLMETMTCRIVQLYPEKANMLRTPNLSIVGHEEPVPDIITKLLKNKSPQG